MSVTVLQLSDLHLLADRAGMVNERSPAGRLDAVMAQWRQMEAMVDRPDLIIVSGDLSENGAPGSYPIIRDTLAALGAPIFAIAGNHDDPAALAECFGAIDTVRVGAWRFVAVPTLVPGNVNGTVDPTELWPVIDSDRDTFTALVMHHPPVTLSDHPYFQLDRADELLAGMADRTNIRLVLSGHLHEAFDRTHHGVRFLGCPSSVYGIIHSGASYAIHRDEGVGARVIVLDDDGSCRTRLLSVI